MLRNRWSISFLVCIALTFSRVSVGQPWSGVLAPVRATDWTQAGIPGGIPSGNWTQCGPTISAYTGSPSTIINAMNHTGTGYAGCTTNQYIQLGAGTFNLSGSILLNGGTGSNAVNYQELRGMGANQTHITFSGVSGCQGGNGTCLAGIQSYDTTYPNQPPAHLYNWTAGYSKGATSITISSGANITANSTWLVLDQCDTGYTGAPCAGTATDNGAFFQCGIIYSATGPVGCAGNGPDTGLARTNRFQWEIVEVTACSPSCGSSGSTTVTVTPPLQHPNWASGQTPQAWLVQPARYVGFNAFSVDGTGTTDTAGISFYNCSYCWATNLAVLNPYNIGIWFSQAIHGVAESNYIYNAGQSGNYFDPTGIKYNGSNLLIDNNITQDIAHVGIMAEGPSNGSVIAYNFIVNQNDQSDFMFGGLWDHSTGDDYNLFEGNVVNQIDLEDTHGGHLSETLYRNFFTGWESCANGQCGSNIKDCNTEPTNTQSYARYQNDFANVLGTPGFHDIYEALNPSSYFQNKTAWVIGAGLSMTATVPGDSVATSSAARWGNYDVVSGTAMYCTAASTPNAHCAGDERGDGAPTYPALALTAPTTFPASFYLSARPTWWSSTIPFPAVGPDVSGGNVNQCSGSFSGGVGTQVSQAGLPATSTSQCSTAAFTGSNWGGHVNAIPAMACFFSMGGVPDGTGSALTFSAASCYGSSSGGGPPAPTGLTATVH